MSVYVDNATWPWRGKLWAHLFADSVEELHNFAARLGLKRAWFQNHQKLPHYDVTQQKRERAIALGAQPVGRRELARHMKRIAELERTG